MKIIFLSLLLISCVSTQDFNKQNKAIDSMQEQFSSLEISNARLQYQIDVRSYRKDMERCGKNVTCRNNTRFLWRRIFDN